MDIKNPHQFKIVSTKIEPILESNLLRIGLAATSGQYYAAVVDPVLQKNYVIYANISDQGNKYKITYRDIADDREHRAISDFFLKAGVFELYYKGSNWHFASTPIEEKDDTKKDRWGRPKRFRRYGETVIPPWFEQKFLK